ncbi:MAG: hypothetical protein KUG77_18020, partial [Nannocystaceae bacterium]|nr:hypothetical protein [Nannocystaceae bacterium]
MSNARQDADAFDDLLGQLVDELAMTPTMPEEAEPDQPVPVPGGTTVGPAPSAPGPAGGGANVVAPHQGTPVDYAEPEKKGGLGLGLGIGIGGAIAAIGVAAIIVLGGKDDEPVADKDDKTEQKADAACLLYTSDAADEARS